MVFLVTPTILSIKGGSCMRHLLLLAAMLGSTVASAAAEVCVRDFIAIDPCARGMDGFAYVVKSSEPDRMICVRTYVDDRCKHAADGFDHVVLRSGERTCTVNFHNPPIAAMCASDPENYVWVDAAYPDDEP
jgi:hypothetical protein